jgi:hypothetical protein
MKTEMVFETSVSTKAEPHYPVENPKDLLQENSLVRRENIKIADIVNSMGRANKSAQLTTNQRAETALRRATTGINTGLGRPPDPHQLNNPDDEDRDSLRNLGVYESRTTLPGREPESFTILVHFPDSSSRFKTRVRFPESSLRFTTRPHFTESSSSHVQF